MATCSKATTGIDPAGIVCRAARLPIQPCPRTPGRRFTRPGRSPIPGAGACHAFLVAILGDDDDSPVAKSLSPGTRKVAFDKLKSGTEATVRLAVVMETADGDRLISDIPEQTLRQNLTEPSCTTGWKRVTATADSDATAAGFRFATEAVAGAMYCIGHNENCGNYRSTDPDFVTGPAPPRLCIGLAHSGRGTDDERKDVDFDACRIRIVVGDGDTVTEANDAATVTGSCGAAD